MFGGIKRDKYDVAISDWVRRRDSWTCQLCFKGFIPHFNTVGKLVVSGLEASHYFGRRKASTRYDEKNIDSLCTACHKKFTEYPHEYTEWKRKKLGGKAYGLLVRRANTPKKWLLSEKNKLYLSLIRKIKEFDNNW
jgi:5-methylcytosine-specific restriction endonuclease McrA